MAKKKVRRARPIVEAYLERIGQKVFKDFSSSITGLIKGRQGIYALYKRDKLYYIGLASNLKNRIKHHLNDKLKNCWTHFSLYIISRQEHIKEFESVILRITYPKGNSVKGKLSKAKNLRPLLKKRQKAGLGMRESVSGALVPQCPVHGRDVVEKILAHFSEPNNKTPTAAGQ